MTRGKELYPWQVLGVDALMTWSTSMDLRGCILGDDIGLGKTATVAAFLSLFRMFLAMIANNMLQPKETRQAKHLSREGDQLTKP